MSTQKQVAKKTQPNPEEEVQEVQAKDHQDLKDELDDLLDEIDSVLEENAQDFVRGYIQRGGG